MIELLSFSLTSLLETRWCLDNSTCLVLEVSDTIEKQHLGMMQRPALPVGCGIWFPFQPAQHPRLWMYKTEASLDMVFVYKGRVLAIKHQVPICRELPCPTYGLSLSQDTDSVIEIGSGEAVRLGIQIGDTVVIEPSGLMFGEP